MHLVHEAWEMIFVIVIRGVKSGTRRLSELNPAPGATRVSSLHTPNSVFFPLLSIISVSPSVSISLVSSLGTFLFIIFSLPTGTLSTMSSTTHFPDAEGFQQQSDNFMSWLQATPGVQLNPKIRLADLRANGAGRGVGKFA